MKNSTRSFVFGSAVILMSFFAETSMAHLKIGTYAGKDSMTGASCEVEIQAVRFENNVRHPINERVQVSHAGRTWTLHHLALIDAEEGTVRPSSDTLESAEGTAGAADAFQLVMSHAPGKDGPVAFHAIHDNYKDSTLSTRLSCRDLSFQSQN